MQAVKDQLTLVRAFIRALQIAPELHSRLRLVMVGDGPLKEEAQALLAQAGMSDLAWLPGERNDVADVLRGLDCFVLPSLAEGISNTILEAMATALPVIATDVGGNGELIDAGRNGELVPAGDAEAMAAMMVAFASDSARAREMAANGYSGVLERFSQMAMVKSYQQVYERFLVGGQVDSDKRAQRVIRVQHDQ
jgi:glycosyltransferase involved in cell wall biosynthesis